MLAPQGAGRCRTLIMLALLTTDDERQLNVIAANDPIYNNLIVRRLLVKAQGGDRAALETLASSHSRLVFKAVKRRFIHAQAFAGGPDAIDLIQEGLYGLTKAILAADTNNPAPFLPYAKRCIEGHILNCLVRSHSIHMPINYAGALYSLPGKLSAGETADSLSDDELARRLNVSSATAKALRNAPVTPDSLDAPAAPDDTRSLGETVCTHEPANELNPIEHEILAALYLDGASHAEIADELGTTERIVAAIAATSISRLGSPLPLAKFSGQTTAIAQSYCALGFKAQTLLHLRLVAGLSPTLIALELATDECSVATGTDRALAAINKRCKASFTTEQVAAALNSLAPLRAAILAQMPEEAEAILTARLLRRTSIAAIAAERGIAVSRVKTVTTDAYAALTRDATTALLLAA